MVKAEVNVLSPHQGGPSTGSAAAFFDQLKQNVSSAPAIRDEDILGLREALKKSTSVNDFLS